MIPSPTQTSMLGRMETARPSQNTKRQFTQIVFLMSITVHPMDLPFCQMVMTDPKGQACDTHYYKLFILFEKLPVLLFSDQQPSMTNCRLFMNFSVGALCRCVHRGLTQTIAVVCQLIDPESAVAAVQGHSMEVWTKLTHISKFTEIIHWNHTCV